MVLLPTLEDLLLSAVTSSKSLVATHISKYEDKSSPEFSQFVEYTNPFEQIR